MSRATFGVIDNSKVMAQGISFSINLSYDKFLQVYQGHAKHVVTKAYDGRTLQFPAEILKPYLTHSGIQGRFVIYFDENNKFKSLEKLT